MSLSLGTILTSLEKGDEVHDNNGYESKDDKIAIVSPNDPSFSMNGSSTLALVDEADSDSSGSCWGARHTMGLLGFLGFTTVYAMRVNLSVAIVAMVRSEAVNASSGNYSDDVCQLPDDYDPESSGNEDGEFDWDSSTQGLILGSFFYGYLFTNIVGGRAAEYMGGKRVLGLGILLTAILTVLSPLAARVSKELFIAVRILEGATEGVTFPAMNALLAFWIPPLEKARFAAFVYSGAQFGTVVTMPVSGWLCDTDFLGGWPSVFYVFGALGIVWSVAWFLLVSDHPESHPRISVEEKNYIIKHCGVRREKPLPVPWIAIFTSLPVWGIMVIHFGQNWGFYTLLTELPTYLKNIQHFDMKSNGLISALPYLTMWISSMVYSSVMDRLLSSGKLSIIAVRRLSMILGIYGPALALIAMCFVNCDAVLAMVVLCIAMGLNGAVYCGYMCSHQDLSPNFAGSLLGLTNTVATIPGFAAPQVTGVITEGNQTLGAWRTVFLISSGVYIVTVSVYLWLITSEKQPWNDVEDEDQLDGEGKKRY